MRHRLLGIGATVAALSLAAVFVGAQGNNEQGQAGGPPTVQGPPAGQVGPGRGNGRGPGQGQGLGPGQQQGPQGTHGRGPMGRGGMGPQGQGPGGRGGGAFAALDLTEDQRAKIEDVHRASRDQAGSIQDELEFTRKTLHRELFADKRDVAKVSTLTAKIATLQKQLADLHVKTAASVADVLTAKQRETMRLRDGRGAGIGRGPVRPRSGAR